MVRDQFGSLALSFLKHISYSGYWEVKINDY